MARLSPSGVINPDMTAINLTRLISRLHATLLEPDGETAHRLRTSVYERNKLGAVRNNSKGLWYHPTNSSSEPRICKDPSLAP